MKNLSLYTMSELSALRFGLSLAVKEVQKTKETCELNPCFTSNAGKRKIASTCSKSSDVR